MVQGHKYRSIEQNRVQNGPSHIWSITFYKVAKVIHGERIVFSINGAEIVGKKMSSETYLTTYTKINWKWIIDLHVKAHVIKLSEENRGENIYYFVVSKISW